MNQIFCFKRYLLLVKRQWYENASVYKWGIALMALTVGFMFWATSTWKVANNPRLGQTETFVVACLFLYVFSAWFFDSLSSKSKKMFYFMLPVSPLERVTVAFTYVMVFMPLLIFSIFTVFDFVAVHLFNHLHDASKHMLLYSTAVTIEGLAVNPMPSFLFLLLSYVSISSFFVLGSLMFGKKGPVLTIAFLIFLPILYIRLHRWLIEIGFEVESKIILWQNNIFIYLFPFCWLAMYFVMKKKEA